jgi:hypothetical protein
VARLADARTVAGHALHRFGHRVFDSTENDGLLSAWMEYSGEPRRRIRPKRFHGPTAQHAIGTSRNRFVSAAANDDRQECRSGRHDRRFPGYAIVARAEFSRTELVQPGFRLG